MLESSLDTIRKSNKGYIGWLMTNQQFLEEVKLLIENKEILNAIHDGRISSQTDLVKGGLDSPPYRELQLFYRRWRLAYMYTPELPCPQGPQIPVVNISMEQQGIPDEELFYYPITIPPFGNGLIAAHQNEVIKRNQQTLSHLAEWLDLISKENPSKNKYEAYFRQFQLKHFWTILKQRFPNELKKQNNLLTDCFAEYFNTDKSTINRDKKNINKRLNVNLFE